MYGSDFGKGIGEAMAIALCFAVVGVLATLAGCVWFLWFVFSHVRWA
jgi:hypothetical protein